MLEQARQDDLVRSSLIDGNRHNIAFLDLRRVTILVDNARKPQSVSTSLPMMLVWGSPNVRNLIRDYVHDLHIEVLSHYPSFERAETLDERAISTIRHSWTERNSCEYAIRVTHRISNTCDGAQVPGYLGAEPVSCERGAGRNRTDE